MDSARQLLNLMMLACFLADAKEADNRDDRAPPSWSKLQVFSFSKWTALLCREVLASKTPFAAF